MNLKINRNFGSSLATLSSQILLIEKLHDFHILFRKIESIFKISIFLVVLGFELWALCLWGRHSTETPPALSAGYFGATWPGGGSYL
jgi:hypothetical protein